MQVKPKPKRKPPHISKYPPKSEPAKRKAYVKRYGLPEGIAHGSSGYRNWHCRCDICSAEWTIVQYNARQARFEKTLANGGIAPTDIHNANTYQNWGCRCTPCSDDYAAKRSQNQKEVA